ncbi:MAG: 4-(cytidine 5'-diphospho)-2-C-methyl-D-erythritol kinase [Muribaculum sp.]|nr:4-(cytidine 5'-diphospho)-2-C-methyl-D-erythritol kinase [Muribaculum sp.]
MIGFVNAKINIGLYVTGRRPDGYHDLSTCFYPVGKYAGTPENESSFCDILEITPLKHDCDDFEFEFSGRKVECEKENNLVVRGARAFYDVWRRRNPMARCPMLIHLEKHLPDGAGLGGGSADCSFTIRMLNELCGTPLSIAEMEAVALTLGADCPVFIKNQPAYAEGVGEKLSPISSVLEGWWCVIVKPNIYVSTREAFAGLTPKKPDINLQEAICLPVEEWPTMIKNDFENTLFVIHPGLGLIKESLYKKGAVYASMSGSGSSVYGLFPAREDAQRALEELKRCLPKNLIEFSSVLLL